MPIVHTSPLPDVDIPDVAVTEYVLSGSHDFGDRAALIDGSSDRTLTFGELGELIDSFAGSLSAAGFTPGDTLAIVAPNIPEYAIGFHGTAVAGGTVTTVNPTYGADEIRFQLQDAQASWLVTVPPFVPTCLEAIEGTAVDMVYVIGEAEGAEPVTSLFGDRIDQVAIDPATQVVALPYSSGTTGLPKGVMLTHRNLVANLKQMDHVVSVGNDEVALAVLPFFHIYGMQVLLNMLLANCATVITMQRFDMVEALELVQKHKITRFFAVPPIVLGLAKAPIIDNYDLSQVCAKRRGAREHLL